MPWKRIGRYALAIVLGGGVGATAPEVSKGITIDPALQQALAGLITAIATVIALRAKSPKGE